MAVVVFAGPSLAPGDRAAFPGFDFRPPVRQGELYAAARRGPRVIAVIDGYFDGVPAVWHKEVLWALDQGIAVLGAASMGALRAAELHVFGMHGIGRIFRDFRDGHLSDDDEVALLHGPAEAGYPALSEPMVNIRATLEAAVVAGIVTAAEAGQLIVLAKGQFYQQRGWPALLAAAGGMPAPLLRSLAEWLPQGRVDQKRADALELLAAVAALRAAPPPAPGFSFEWTEAWANAPWLAGADAGADSGADSGDDADAVLDELRLEGADYLALRQAALLQVLAAAQPAAPVDSAAQRMGFRLRHGLLRQQDADDWAARNGITRAGLDRLIAAGAGVEQLGRSRDPTLGGAILDQLRLRGRYEGLRARARQRVTLPEAAAVPPLPLLLAWYFETRLGQPIPEDLPAHARDLGFSDPARFCALIASEFRRLRPDAGSPRGQSVVDRPVDMG